MNTDFRVSVAFTRHLKTRRLIRRLGYEAVFGLLQLWTFTAMYMPKGVLVDMTAEEVEDAAEWNGTPGAFFQAMIELGFLDRDEQGVLSVHDWEEHNNWAANAPERSAKARKASSARWEKKTDAQTGSEHDAQTGSEHDAQTGSEHDAQTGSEQHAPSPSPSPFLLKDTHSSPDGDGARLVTGTESEDIPPKPRGKARADACPHKSVIDLYHEILPECPHVEVWPEDCRRKLAARWREDKTRQELDWWRNVFRRVGQSDFLMGRVEGRGFVFSLTWFVEPKNFAKVLNGNYDNRAAPAGYSGGANAHAASNPGRQIGELTFA